MDGDASSWGCRACVASTRFSLGLGYHSNAILFVAQASGHGGDLRDIVQQLIEDCRRMPPLPRFVMAEEEEEAGTSQALREQRIESDEDSNDAGGTPGY